jgi:hypothetical protein
VAGAAGAGGRLTATHRRERAVQTHRRDRANSTHLPPLFRVRAGAAGIKVLRMSTAHDQAPSDHRTTLALRLAPALMVTVFALVGADLLMFDAAVAISLAAAVWVVYELHAHQRALDEHQLRTMHEQRVWPEFDPDDAVARAPELLIDSRFG